MAMATNFHQSTVRHAVLNPQLPAYLSTAGVVVRNTFLDFQEPMANRERAQSEGAVPWNMSRDETLDDVHVEDGWRTPSLWGDEYQDVREKPMNFVPNLNDGGHTPIDDWHRLQVSDLTSIGSISSQISFIHPTRPLIKAVRNVCDEQIFGDVNDRMSWYTRSLWGDKYQAKDENHKKFVSNPNDGDHTPIYDWGHQQVQDRIPTDSRPLQNSLVPFQQPLIEGDRDRQCDSIFGDVSNETGWRTPSLWDDEYQEAEKDIEFVPNLDDGDLTPSHDWGQQDVPDPTSTGPFHSQNTHIQSPMPLVKGDTTKLPDEENSPYDSKTISDLTDDDHQHVHSRWDDDYKQEYEYSTEGAEAQYPITNNIHPITTTTFFVYVLCHDLPHIIGNYASVK